jgi:hypothetical protein
LDELKKKTKFLPFPVLSARLPTFINTIESATRSGTPHEVLASRNRV